MEIVERTCRRGHLVSGDNSRVHGKHTICVACREYTRAANKLGIKVEREPREFCANGHLLFGENLCPDLLPKRRCRICRNAYASELRKYERKFGDDRVKRRYRNTKLKEKYGITLEDKERLTAKQDNKCAVCSSEFSDTNKPCVDHDHITKQVRGILCHPCNRAIGLLKDNSEVLIKAAEYLNRSRTEGN